MYSIYMIENKINGKKYVGKTNNPTKRQLDHFSNSHNIPLRRAIKKYGKEFFEFTILESNLNEDNVNDAEIMYVEKHKAFISGYNLTPGGEGGNTLLDPAIAKKHSIATSKGRVGLKRKPFSDEHKAKLAKVLLENNCWTKRTRKVLVENQIFVSQTEAAKQLGILQATINYRLKAGAPGYKYLDIMEI